MDWKLSESRFVHNMRLYIIRHGETEWNHTFRLQGQTDIPLNENGRVLAQVTARALQPIPFDLCISSPLQRAKETALLVLGGKDIPVITDARIQEIGFGTYEGRRVRDAKGEITDPKFFAFFRDPGNFIPPEGGESISDLLARTGAFLEELSTRKEWYDKTILISTHGAASRAMLLNIRHGEQKDFWDTGVPKNCAVTIADLEPQKDSTLKWIIKEQDITYYENI